MSDLYHGDHRFVVSKRVLVINIASNMSIRTLNVDIITLTIYLVGNYIFR